tara:strand:+ start:190 stop:483 length:294 start_codon:yes stop_codon:yes gene_type:complete
LCNQLANEEGVGEIMSHEFKDEVDKFMDHINVAINLRLESDRRSRSVFRKLRAYQEQIVSGTKLRKESDKMLRDTEYMLYELIDNAMEEGVLHAQRD